MANRTKIFFPLGCLILLCATFFAVRVLTYGRPLFAPTPQELTEIGTPIVTALKQYRMEHGRFPATLDLAGIENIETAYGKFIYEASADGTECNLWIGDYGKYLFEVRWWSGYGWYIDT